MFLLELVTASLPGEYNKESWAMDYDEKFEALPKLREEGNHLYGEQQYHEAATKYAEALNMLEQLCLRLVTSSLLIYFENMSMICSVCMCPRCVDPQISHPRIIRVCKRQVRGRSASASRVGLHCMMYPIDNA